MEINNKYNIEEIVFLITDEDQKARIITAIQICKNGLFYKLACGTDESWHYEYELATDKNFKI